MKKTLLLLLTVLICFALCLTACNSSDDPTITKGPGKDNTDNQTSTRLDKTAAVEAFNSLDFKALLENSGISEEDSLSLLNELKLGMDLTLSSNNSSQMKLSVAVKDGYAYYKNSRDGYSQSNWIYFGNGDFTTFYENGGVWEAAQAYSDIEQSQAEIGIAFEQIEALIDVITIPELKESHLTEKDGMLIISNEYILQALRANSELLAGESLSEEELDEAMEEVENGIKATGLKIAFAANENAVTKLSLSLSFDKNTELGKEFIEDSSFSAMSISIDATDDGTAIKNISISLTNAFDKYEKGYAPKTSLSLSTVFNNQNEPVGFDVNGELYSVTQQLTEGIVGGPETSEILLSKITAKGFFDSTKMKTAGAECANISFTTETVKAFKRTAQYDDEWNLTSEKIEAISLSTATTMDISASLKVKSEGANKLAISGAYNVVAGNESVSISISGSAYMNNVLNFPTQIPAEILAYANAQ